MLVIHRPTTTVILAMGLLALTLLPRLHATDARGTLRITLVVRAACQVNPPSPASTTPPTVDCHQAAPYDVRLRRASELSVEERQQWATLAPGVSIGGVWTVTF